MRASEDYGSGGLWSAADVLPQVVIMGEGSLAEACSVCPPPLDRPSSCCLFAEEIQPRATSVKSLE